MPILHRVFPYVATSAGDEPGGAFYVPPQGGGRLDNPETYSVLYLSDAPAGAIAEAFGRFPEWNEALLEGAPSLPGSARALASFHLPEDAPVCNLDDPMLLQTLGLRPSDIVSRDYARTRAWARRIHEQGSWFGVRWWSYYDSQWASFGLWNISRLKLQEVKLLRLDEPALLDASRTVARRIVRRSGKI
ncbi:MAG: RES family NAD+ phosphorylase [Bryobacteraceae bacterium]